MKKITLTLEDIFEYPGIEIFNPDEFTPVSAISIDSRNILPNSLFVAIKGKKFDGHNYLKTAIEAGATAVLVNRKKLKLTQDFNVPVIAVDDTIDALGYLARLWRNKLNTRIIGITGSAGKTSTKEILSILLSSKYKVNKTVANNNNHIGVPLTLFSTTNKFDYLVLELGTNHFGEIAYTSMISLPDAGIITNIGASHLEYLTNLKGVLAEKSVLLDVVHSYDGKVYINNDDKLLSKLAKNYKSSVTFGLNNDSDVTGKVIDYDDYGYATVEIKGKKQKFSVKLPLIGESSVKNFVAACAIALNEGLTKADIEKVLPKLKAYDKRLNIKRKDDCLIVDDTYNANPESMKSSIELLSKMKAFKNKVAILGDMFELGLDSEKLHKDLAKTIKKNKIDAVLVIGSLMKHLEDELKNTKVSSQYFISRNSLKKFLKQQDFKDSVILVKGSRGMKMEEFVEVLESK